MGPALSNDHLYFSMMQLFLALLKVLHLPCRGSVRWLLHFVYYVLCCSSHTVIVVHLFVDSMSLYPPPPKKKKKEKEKEKWWKSLADGDNCTSLSSFWLLDWENLRINLVIAVTHLIHSKNFPMLYLILFVLSRSYWKHRVFILVFQSLL